MQGTPPSPRAGHTAVVYGKSMYVYGGYDKNGLSCHDLHEFTFENNTWSLLSPKGISPPDTYHHSAVTYQGSMYVLGGYRTESSALQEYRFGMLRHFYALRIRDLIPNRYWNLVSC